MKFFQALLVFFITIFLPLVVLADPEPALTLEDAIALGIRDNPSVQGSRLGLTSEKFNVWVNQWKFLPHFSLTANAGVGKTRSAWQIVGPDTNMNVLPSASWTSPIGTEVTLKASNSKGKHYNPGVSVEIMQPLLRGFGRAIVENELNNAKDNEFIAHLDLEATLRSTVTEIILAYLNVVTEEQKVAIDRQALARAQESVKQTKIFIESGRKAGNELITVEANVANTRTQLESDMNSLVRMRYALLTAIGINPNAEMLFSPLDVDKLIAKYSYPTLAETVALTLKNDIQYRKEIIVLEGSTKRALMIAEDNMRPKLSLKVDAGVGGSQGNGGYNAGINSLFNGSNWNQSAGLTLEIPIDDQLAKQALLGHQIALKKARIALQQTKWNKETSAINGWNLVAAAKRSLAFAEDAARLQQKTYDVSYQKYLHGLIDSLELQTAQDSLIRAQQTLLRSRIDYLKALVDFDMLIGHTLKTWNIETRS